MAQNIYDDDQFFAGYATLPRSVGGLDGAPEWPSLRALLPPLRGLRVLDLGCGYGWFCRWASEAGAAQVLGIDVSEKMLARARADTRDGAIVYRQADLEGLELSAAAFDLVYSSLAFHYVADFRRLTAQIHDGLVPGGRLVFSVEHPIYSAATHARWIVDADGNATWPVDHYLVEGPRSRDWFAKGVVKHHRTIGTTLNALLRAGFSLSHVEEWGPSAAQIAALPSLAGERHRPMFLLVAATKA